MTQTWSRCGRTLKSTSNDTLVLDIHLLGSDYARNIAVSSEADGYDDA
jgi:hypothetical protein